MLKLAFLNLWRHKRRTILSLLGIVIGVAAIIAMVGLVDGMLKETESAVGKLQGVFVLQDGAYNLFFSKVDASYAAKLEAIPGVKVAVPIIFALPSTVEGAAGISMSGAVRMFGVDYSKQAKTDLEVLSYDLIEGRKLNASDKGKVIIGKELADTYNKFIGNKIRLDNSSYEIVGIYTTHSKLLDASLFMPIDDLRAFADFPEDKASQFSLGLNSPEDAEKIVSMVNFKFENKLQAKSASDYAKDYEDILGNLRLVVVLVAAISAIVAGIGIINTVLMSVVERFNEIGSLKATGWTDGDVMKMILFEAGFIGVVGGVFGLALGIIVGLLIQDSLGVAVLFSPLLLASAFLFAVCIGIIAGLYPAYIASKMDPVEALHYE
ncbi:MAG: ABC transporter permease [Candidatus Diapherotrites archaeon]